jgi:hypothetical protein
MCRPHINDDMLECAFVIHCATFFTNSLYQFDPWLYCWRSDILAINGSKIMFEGCFTNY